MAVKFLQGNNNQQKCVFVTSASFQKVILNPQSTMSNGLVLISEGVSTSLAISVEEKLFLFVATTNSVEKVSKPYSTPPDKIYCHFSIFSQLIVMAPL